MAIGRIRSIKPTFWVDKKIATVPKSTALFFIALWSFADDQGIVEDDSKSLSLQVPIYRSQDVHKMLNALWKAGLVMRSPSDGLVLVRGWAHQRIDRPRDGKYKDIEINWLPWSANKQMHDESSNGLDRSVSEQTGEDSLPSDVNIGGSVAKIHAPKKSKTKAAGEGEGETETAPTWGSYSEVYSRTYGVGPVRNRTTNSQMKAFVKRIGVTEAPQVAAFYLTHRDSTYVRAMHPVGLLLMHAEKLRTEWATGRTMLGTHAREIEKHERIDQVFDWARDNLETKDNENETHAD